MMVFVSLIYVGFFLGLLWMLGDMLRASKEPWYGGYRRVWQYCCRAYHGHPKLTSRSDFIERSFLPGMIGREERGAVAQLPVWTAGGRPLPSNWRKKWKPQDPKPKPSKRTPYLNKVLKSRES